MLQQTDKVAFEATLRIFNNVEAANYLKVSTRTLSKYRSQGLIEYVQIGRKILYTERHLQDFLKRNTKQAFNLKSGSLL